MSNVLFIILSVVCAGSGLHPVYAETSQKIQKWIKRAHFVCIDLIPPLCIVPSFLTSFYTYFTTDLGADAFQQQFDAW